MDAVDVACAGLGIASDDVIASHVYADRVVVVVRQGGKFVYPYTATQPAVIASNEAVGPLPFDEPPDPSAVPEIAPEDSPEPQPDAPQSILPQEAVKSRRKRTK